MSGTNNGMKKRWISLYVENQVGVCLKFPDSFLESHIIWTALL